MKWLFPWREIIRQNEALAGANRLMYVEMKRLRVAVEKLSAQPAAKVVEPQPEPKSKPAEELEARAYWEN